MGSPPPTVPQHPAGGHPRCPHGSAGCPLRSPGCCGQGPGALGAADAAAELKPLSPGETGPSGSRPLSPAGMGVVTPGGGWRRLAAVPALGRRPRERGESWVTPGSGDRAWPGWNRVPAPVPRGRAKGVGSGGSAGGHWEALGGSGGSGRQWVKWKKLGALGCDGMHCKAMGYTGCTGTHWNALRCTGRYWDALGGMGCTGRHWETLVHGWGQSKLKEGGAVAELGSRSRLPPAPTCAGALPPSPPLPAIRGRQHPARGPQPPGDAPPQRQHLQICLEGARLKRRSNQTVMPSSCRRYSRSFARRAFTLRSSEPRSISWMSSSSVSPARGPAPWVHRGGGTGWEWGGLCAHLSVGTCTVQGT